MPVLDLRFALPAAVILGSLLGALSSFGDAARITVLFGIDAVFRSLAAG